MGRVARASSAIEPAPSAVCARQFRGPTQSRRRHWVSFAVSRKVTRAGAWVTSSARRSLTRSAASRGYRRALPADWGATARSASSVDLKVANRVAASTPSSENPASRSSAKDSSVARKDVVPCCSRTERAARTQPTARASTVVMADAHRERKKASNVRRCVAVG